MTPASMDRFVKSTTGRFLSQGMRLLDAVAPAAAERLAFELFATPQRKREKPFILGHRFSVVGDGPELNVWDWGEGPTVLLVHGWNSNAAQLAGFVAPLLRAGHYVAAADMPGHGDSAGKRSNVLEMADAILRVGRRVGPVHAVIAHSLGAAATVIALAEGLNASRAVLIAPPTNLPRFAQEFARTVGLSPRSSARMVSRLDQMLGGRDAIDIARLARGQRANALILHDPADREVPFADSRTLANAWPGATFLPLSGAGHSRALRHPEVISRAVGFVIEPARLSSLIA